MKANPDKFSLIILSGRNRHEKVTLKLRSAQISSVPEVKLLGVTLDQNLNFTSHVRNVCKKAARQINAMSRLTNMLSIQTKLSMFNAFVKSNFAYCTLVFHFCGVNNDKKLEKMFERALRTVYNDYSCPYHELLKRSNSKLLYEEREDLVIELVYKILQRISPQFNVFRTQCYSQLERHKVVSGS